MGNYEHEKKYFLDFYHIYLDHHTSWPYLSSVRNYKRGCETPCSLTRNFLTIHRATNAFSSWKNRSAVNKCLRITKRSYLSFPKYSFAFICFLANFTALLTHKLFVCIMEEIVVLVNRQNKVLGTAPKLATHNNNTPLHRGFSVFLFNSKGQLLLQQRSKSKKTWPLSWSNSVCGHPILNESNIDAAKRRLEFELGIKENNVYEILPDFSYKADMNGIVENEICPVLVAFSNQIPIPNSDEVENILWLDWKDFIKDVSENPRKFSMWCEKEAKLLEKNKKFLNLYKKFTY